MLKSTAIYPYKMSSKSAGFLSQALDVPRILHNKSKFKGNPNKVVINWGASELPPEVLKCRVLNKLSAVRAAGNKLWFFQKMMTDANVRTVPWTHNRSEALEWLKTSTVVVRTVLTGHSGNGIIVVEKGATELPNASLYTKYIPKDMEFRVHIVNKEVVDVQRKIRDPDREPTNWKVRSHANGFIYVREGFETPRDVLEQAKLAFCASELDFGAFDIIWNHKSSKAYVLEANTAPGLQGQTVGTYVEALEGLCR